MWPVIGFVWIVTGIAAVYGCSMSDNLLPLFIFIIPGFFTLAAMGAE
jgi:hypothetical protein